MRNIFARSHTKYQWSCSYYCLEPGRRKGERRGGGKRDWGFCGVVGFPTGWQLHFVSFTGRSSEPFCLVELLYKSWGRGYRSTDCRLQSWVWTWGGEDWGLRRCLVGGGACWVTCLACLYMKLSWVLIFPLRSSVVLSTLWSSFFLSSFCFLCCEDLSAWFHLTQIKSAESAHLLSRGEEGKMKGAQALALFLLGLIVLASIGTVQVEAAGRSSFLASTKKMLFECSPPYPSFAWPPVSIPTFYASPPPPSPPTPYWAPRIWQPSAMIHHNLQVVVIPHFLQGSRVNVYFNVNVNAGCCTLGFQSLELLQN